MFFVNALAVINTTNLINSLRLMLKGMVGILVVMFLIYLVIVILSRVFDKKIK